MDNKLRDKALEHAESGRIGEYKIADALVSIAYSLIRYMDMNEASKRIPPSKPPRAGGVGGENA